MAIFVLVIYALFKDYKRNSLEAMAKSTNTNYQKLQYFLSDSKWDMPAIKQKRLEIIQQQRTTALRVRDSMSRRLPQKTESLLLTIPHALNLLLRKHRVLNGPHC
jgi:SRSO17 transposase